MHRAKKYAERILRRYSVGPEHGFLGPRDPVCETPTPYSRLFREHLKLGLDMPELVAAGGNAYERRVLKLPVIDRALIRCAPKGTLLRLAVTLSFLTQAYIWQDRRNPRRVLPAQLAVPMYAIGRLLDVAPLLIYQFYALANWRRMNKRGPIAVENIRMLQNFNADIDGRRTSEEWFVGIHVEIESIAGQVIKDVFMIDHAIERGDHEVVTDRLSAIEVMVNLMEGVLARMNEHCDPDIYYHHVRPYLFGWYNVLGGVVYEGVPELFGGGQTWRGQTGAQSSVAPLLDALLCVPHEDPKLSDHLKIMLRWHTPKDHRDLVAALSDYNARAMRWAPLLDENNAISERYYRVRRALADFRRQHYDHALVYIAKPALREREMSPQGDTIIPGTGGSDLIKSLKLHIAETLVHGEREQVMSEYEEHWQKLYHSK